MYPEIMNIDGCKALCYFNPLLLHFGETANEEKLCGGFHCRLFDEDDLLCKNCLGEFDLGVGFEIPDASNEALQDGIRTYINDHAADLSSEGGLNENDAPVAFGPQL